MLSTSVSFTSDYYSGSEQDYDDSDEDVVRAAPHHHHLTKQTNIILQTLLHHHHHHSSSHVSSSIRLQRSLTLLKLARENGLSDEIFIRANTILHHFLLSTGTNDVNRSIMIACLSLSTKLSEHSTHFTTTLFNSSSLAMNEEMICNAMEWDIDLMTPINYVEALLLYVNDCSERDRLRRLSYEMVVLCLTDVKCMELCVASLGMDCLVMACELLECGDTIRNEVCACTDTVMEASLIYIRQLVTKTFCR